MTTAAEAYEQGREAKRSNPKVTRLPNIIPYSARHLSWAWIDGFIAKDNAPCPYNKYRGNCPFCWSLNMTDSPDGILRCTMYLCREHNFPPVNRDEIKFFMGKRDAGSYI